MTAQLLNDLGPVRSLPVFQDVLHNVVSVLVL